MPVKRAVVIGTGHHLPTRVVSNAEFAQKLDTTDEWIRARTGIERRHFAAEGELTSDLAIPAAQMAMDRAGVGASDIDAIVLATSTADDTFPSTATKVQAALGIHQGFAYDLQAVCAGFVFAVANAEALITSGQANTVLVIGAETFSRILDWEDRGTCVLFGDGAGAVVMQGQDGAGTSDDRGILATDLNSDGRYRDILFVDGGVSSTGSVGLLRMQGREVFKHAVTKLAQTGETALAKIGLSAGDVNWLVPHQANLRIIAKTAEKMGLPSEKLVLTVQDHGNTSAASIPLALSIADGKDTFSAGDLILMEGIGGGLAWGAIALRW